MTKEKFIWVALILVGIIILIHFFQINYQILTEIFSLNSSRFLSKPWILITYMFLHGDLKHLYFNMFALVMFGLILESIVGYKRFLLIFFLSGIVSGIFSIFFYSEIIGASGAIFGVIGVLTSIRPKMIIWALGVPMPIILAVILWSIIDLLGVFYPDQTAHIGHLSGLVFGLITGFVLRKKYKIIEEKNEKIVISDKEIEEWEKKWLKRNI